MLGIAPPRPLPSAAYDLLTALESVQHFATRILAGVVQSEATNGSFALGFDDTQAFRQPRSGSHSPIRGGGGARAAATALFAKEQADAAGLGEEWEKAWPPRELTAALALVTARQMAHAMRCDSEPLMQVRGRHGMAVSVLWVVCVFRFCLKFIARLAFVFSCCCLSWSPSEWNL